MKKAIIIFFISTMVVLFAADWPQNRNSFGNTSPEKPTSIYLGDIVTFGCDSWATCNGNWPRWRVVIRYNDAAIDGGIYGDYTSYSNIEHKTTYSPRFTQIGTWYWGIQVDYGSNPIAWYCRDNASWENMWGTPTSNLAVTVLALQNPTDCNLSRHTSSPFTQVDISFSKWNSKNVMIVRKKGSSVTWIPAQGTSYSDNQNVESDTYIIKASQFDPSFTDSYNLEENATYYYKFYSENYNYFSDGVELSSVTLLPVELTYFTADIIGKEINLNWKTATEVNNYGFNVERRTKSEEWNTIGFVNGCGNSNSPKEYSYKDKTAAAGNYTYRLKQIDNDGQFKYSPEVEVAVNNIIDGYILEQNYPNPFNPATSIKFGFNNDTEVNLLVFDQIGNQVATLFSGKAEAGRIYNVEFNAEGLSSGIYFYRLETPLKSEVRKMLLMK